MNSQQLNVFNGTVCIVHNLVQISQHSGVLHHVILHVAGVLIVALLPVEMTLGQVSVHHQKILQTWLWVVSSIISIIS